MRNRFAFFVLVLFVSSIVGAAGETAAKPDEGSLLAAWEAALKTDPATEVLEKTAERTYRFKTKLFPFDGELKVLNTLIQDYGDEEYAPGFAFGSVEVELVGFSQEQMTRYARSYSYWYQLNTLFFDRQSGRWLSAKEYRATAFSRNPLRAGNPFVSWLAQNYFWMIMALLALFLWWLAKKSGRQFKSALAKQNEAMEFTQRAIALSEKAVQLNEEANLLLKEILQELKNRK
jgi:hypothetical protein